MKNKILKIKNWIYKNPKKFYKYSMILLVCSFSFQMINEFFFKKDIQQTISSDIPVLYSRSEKKNNDYANKETEMKKIVKQLMVYKEKRKEKTLTKSDSLKIDYLYNKYNELKHEKEN